ncbi:MAG: HepT-like ribonuclease domain-containing protein [bacterium]
MTLPPDEVRLRHIRDAIQTAVRFVAGRERHHLDTEEMLRLALTKLVEIVGEAAKQVNADTRARYPDVAWADAARMRDRLVHHYFDIDLDILWATVTEDLPSLLSGLEAT